MESSYQPEKHWLFVYGTLKRNEPNYFRMEERDSKGQKAEFIGEGLTKQKFPLVIATRHNVPFLIDAPGKGQRIHGEIYRISTEMLQGLDVFEEVPAFFLRKNEDIEVLHGSRDINLSATSDSVQQPAKTLSCNLYVLHNYNSNMLMRPTYSSYSSKGSHGLEYIPGETADEVSAEIHAPSQPGAA